MKQKGQIDIGRYIDIAGQNFGRLTAIKCVGKDNHGAALWFCKCSCGNEKIIRGDRLRSGEIVSCGCYQKECRSNTAKEMGRHNITHGLSHDRLYYIYNNMIRRCCEKTNTKYKNYGKRGICVCKEWRDDKSAFFQWARESGYSEELTLDRVDVNKGYFPDNCRWATQKQQANNKTNNTQLSYGEETHTLSEWADITGISRATISARINEYGWSVDEALSTPVRHTK